jgi:hypothetical protein
LSASSRLFLRSEEHQVLPGQLVEGANLFEPAGSELEQHLLPRHLVLGLDRDPGVFGTKFEQREHAAWAEGALEMSEHRRGVGELVIHVREQDEVARPRGQLRIRRRAEQRLHVGDVSGLRALVQEAQHLWLDVDGDRPSLGCDHPRHLEGVVAIPRADIARDVAGLKAQLRQHARGILLGLALGSNQPSGAFVRHGRCDAPAHVVARAWLGAGRGRRGGLARGS